MTKSWDDIIGETLESARQAGEFDRHPRKGKPLDLEPEHPLADPSLAMAHSLLKESGFSLPWIEEGQEIERQRHEAHKTLARALSRLQEEEAAGRPYQTIKRGREAALQSFRQQIASLNKLIAAYNLRVPAAGFQKIPLVADIEIRRVQQQMR